MNEQPVKQFYNRKTKKWHVYFRNPENGDVRIKQVNDVKMPDVRVIGKYRPDGNESAKQLYSKPENKNDSGYVSTKERFPERGDKIKMVTDTGKIHEGFYEPDRAGYFNFDNKEIIGVVKWKPLKKDENKNERKSQQRKKPKNESENEDSANGFFDFL